MLLGILGILGIQKFGQALNTQSGRNNPNEWGVYIDGNGHQRLLKNGRKVVDTFDSNGDRVIKYANDGQIAVNITKKESSKREQIAKEIGKKFYLRQQDRGNNCNKLGINSICGERYCKVGNPYIYYVKRTIIYRKNDCTHQMDFYMDMNKNLCCPTEEQISKDIEFIHNHKHHSYTCKMIILDDYTPLYQTIIEEWNRSKQYIDGMSRVVYLGEYNHNDYKSTRDRIKRW